MSVERETVPDLQRASVLMVASEDIGWAALRTILHDEWGVRITGDVSSAEDAIRTARAQHPDAILLAADVAGGSVTALTVELRRCSPSSKIVVLGQVIDRDTLTSLLQAGIHGFLLWHEVRRPVLRQCLSTVLDVGLWVGSPRSLAELASPLPGRQKGLSIDLTTQEQSVLRALVVEGLFEGEIAQRESMSIATVQRLIRSLKYKLEARTLCHLGVRAYELGLA